MTKQPDVQIIIATTAEIKRKESLITAINSILSQSHINASPLIIINGNRFDPELKRHLESRLDLKVVYDSTPSAPNAHRVGRLHIVSDYFGFLDDDDELTPDSLSQRVGYLKRYNDCSLVVSNGYRCKQGVDKLMFSTFQCFASNPAESLLQNNWMACCAGVFRAKDIGVEYFENYSDFMEWTVVGFKIAQGLKVSFLDEPGYRINYTLGSLSQSEKYIIGCVDAIQRMKKECELTELEAPLSQKYVNALHDASVFFLQQGDRRSAFYYHLKCLFSKGGIRYLSYTRRFFGL